MAFAPGIDFSNADSFIKLEDGKASMKMGNVEENSRDAMKKRFDDIMLKEYPLPELPSRKIWNREKISQIIKQIKNAKASFAAGDEVTPMDKYVLKRYRSKTEGGKEYLMTRRTVPRSHFLKIIPREELFEVLYEAHESCHAGKSEMTQIFKSRKIYVALKPIDLYLSICSCKQDTSPWEVEQVVSNARGVFSLIDLRFSPDGEYTWLLHYHDVNTKYTHLRPLKSNRASEVAGVLFKMFNTFVSPNQLNCDSDRGFTEEVLEELSKLWPQCSINTAHFDAVSKLDAEALLKAWMKINHSRNWFYGCQVVEYQMNVKNHALPYKPNAGIEVKSPQFPAASPDPDVVTDEDIKNVLKQEQASTVTAPNFVCSKCKKVTSGATKCDACHYRDMFEFEENIIQSTVIHAKDTKSKKYKPKIKRKSHRLGRGAAFLELCNNSTDLPPIPIGTSVVVSLDEPYIRQFGTSSIKGKIVADRNGYVVGTKSGTIKKKFHRNQLRPSRQVYNEDISDVPITLNDAILKERDISAAPVTNDEVQGCACVPGLYQCGELTCKCANTQVVYSLDCH